MREWKARKARKVKDIVLNDTPKCRSGLSKMYWKRGNQEKL
ncbi:MAG: hypothetical protein WC721_05475 [Victivallaceae bacterium]